MPRAALAVGVVVALFATAAQAEFPFLAIPNRCDTSGLPLGCIPLAERDDAAPPGAATATSGSTRAPTSARPTRW